MPSSKSGIEPTQKASVEWKLRQRCGARPGLFEIDWTVETASQTALAISRAFGVGRLVRRWFLRQADDLGGRDLPQSSLSRPKCMKRPAPDMLLWIQGCRYYVTQPRTINRGQGKCDTITHPPRLAHPKCQWESATGLFCSGQSSRVLSTCGTFLN